LAHAEAGTKKPAE